jgi:hypothetical protein
VEAVETLLGRKYRLVCDLTAAPHPAAAAAAGPPGTAGVVGPDGVLRVPAACYRNQAPAPGVYRVLVRLVDSGPPGGEIAAEPSCVGAPGSDTGTAVLQLRTSLTSPGFESGSLRSSGPAPEPVVGPVCVPVRISQEGLEVDLGPQAGGAAGVGDGPPPARPLLLLDFDACA